MIRHLGRLLTSQFCILKLHHRNSVSSYKLLLLGLNKLWSGTFSTVQLSRELLFDCSNLKQPLAFGAIFEQLHIGIFEKNNNFEEHKSIYVKNINALLGTGCVEDIFYVHFARCCSDVKPHLQSSSVHYHYLDTWKKKIQVTSGISTLFHEKALHN